MKHNRYTIKELSLKTNKQLILNLITERQNDCTNDYSPLYQRLQKLELWVIENVKDEPENFRGW